MLTWIVVLYIAHIYELPTWCLWLMAFEMTWVIVGVFNNLLAEIAKQKHLKDIRENEEYLQDM